MCTIALSMLMHLTPLLLQRILQAVLNAEIVIVDSELLGWLIRFSDCLRFGCYASFKACQERLKRGNAQRSGRGFSGRAVEPCLCFGTADVRKQALEGLQSILESQVGCGGSLQATESEQVTTEGSSSARCCLVTLRSA